MSERQRTGDAIAAANRDRNGALIGYLPVGFPTVDESIRAGIATLKAGADVLELGVPYSDPVMDGPTIQAATTAALAGGVRLRDTFRAVREITAATGKPVIVMTYFNPVFRYGVDRFAADLAEAGGAGLITPDLVPDEAAEWIAASDRHDLDRVFLVAPSSTEARVESAVRASRGFVYAVSTMGTTGARTEMDEAAREVVAGIHRAGDLPACVGLGISRADQVADVLSYADGAIVGSALVRALADDGVDRVTAVTRELATGTV